MNRLLSLLLFFPATLYAQNIDSLYTAYSHSADKNVRVQCANSIFDELHRMEFTDSLYHFSESTPPAELDARVSYWIAEYEQERSHYDDAIVLSEKALKWLERNGSDVEISDCCSLLGICHQRKGDFTAAIDYMERCCDYDRHSGDKERISSSLNNLAALCLAIDQPEQAERYILEAIAIERTLDRPARLAIRLGIGSEIYLRLNRTNDALRFACEAYDIDCDGGRTGKAAVRATQIAAIYMEMGRDNDARNYLNKAKPELERSGNINSLSICHNCLGTLDMRAARTVEAADHFHHAIELCRQTGNRFVCSKAYKGLWQALRDSNPREALYNLEKYTAIADSVYSEQVARQVANFNTKYETAEKEFRINMQQATLRTHRIILAGILIFVLACIVAIIILWRMLVLRRRHTATLIKIAGIKDRLRSLLPDNNEPLQSHTETEEEIASIADELGDIDKLPAIKFTARERDVARLCCEGLQTKEIADRMGVSLRTVESHKSNIFRKLGINSTVELMHYAIKTGIIRQ